MLHYTAFPDGDGGGNPAAVVFTPDSIDPAGALALAAQIGYSETAFVGTPDHDGTRLLRYFSPSTEVPFCGHATIAVAVALTERHDPGTFAFHTRAGLITVQTSWQEQRPLATITSPPTSSRPASEHESAAALRALRWRADELDPTLPVHVASAGAHHLIVPAGSRERLAALDYDFPALRELMTDRGWTTVHLTWRERADRWHARDPFPVGGVVEDPATGAAAAAFGGYLRVLGHVPLPYSLEIRQGADMGRPSRLLVHLPAGEPTTLVSGTAIRIPAP